MHYCEVAGRTSALIMLTALGSVVFVATALDLFR
jgi:hypothetical protein